MSVKFVQRYTRHAYWLSWGLEYDYCYRLFFSVYAWKLFDGVKKSKEKRVLYNIFNFNFNSKNYKILIKLLCIRV